MLLFSALIFILLAVNLGVEDLVAGDEGYYGVMARNISEDSTYLINPSLSPLGPPGDKPFLYPLILAGALGIGGIDEIPLRLTTLAMALAGCLLLIPVGRAMGHAEAGRWAALLMLCSPYLAHFGRRVAAEVPVVAFGLLGVWLLLTASGQRSLPRAAAAGAVFGLGFLCKLWLVAPLLLAGFGAVLASRPPMRGDDIAKPARRGPVLVLAALGFLGVASLQLVLCLLLSPETAPHWMRVYLGFSLTERLAGTGFADYWHKPWSFYLVTLSQVMGMWLPILALGVVVIVMTAGRRSALHGALLLWWLPLLGLSVASVKSGNYLAPMVPGFALASGVGLAWLRAQAWSTGPTRRTTLLAAAALGLGACGFAFVKVRGDVPVLTTHPVTAGVGLLWIALFFAWGVARAHTPRWRVRAAVAILAGTCLVGLARDAQLVTQPGHVTGYARLAEELAPGLTDVDPRDPCFYAAEAPALSFYTFRTGRYWNSPYLAPDSGGVREALSSHTPRFFVITPTPWGLYGGQPDSVSLALIREEGHSLLSSRHTNRPHPQCYLNESLNARLSTRASTHVSPRSQGELEGCVPFPVEIGLRPPSGVHQLDTSARQRLSTPPPVAPSSPCDHRSSAA